MLAVSRRISETAVSYVFYLIMRHLVLHLTTRERQSSVGKDRFRSERRNALQAENELFNDQCAVCVAFRFLSARGHQQED